MKLRSILLVPCLCLSLPVAAAVTSPLRWQNLKRPPVPAPMPAVPLPEPQRLPLPQTVEDYLRAMDTDGDGRVSLPEYRQWMGHAFVRMDVDDNRLLDAAELPGGKGPSVTREQHDMRMGDRFHRQDIDGDGYLDIGELSAPPR